MKLGDLFLELRDGIESAMLWFGNGADKLWQLEILELTLGQAAITIFFLYILFLTIKENLEESKSKNETEGSWWKKIFYRIQYLGIIFLYLAGFIFVLGLIQGAYNS